jgi:hypothetical protein
LGVAASASASSAAAGGSGGGRRPPDDYGGEGEGVAAAAPGARRHGSVRLGRAAGAMATVEATAVARALGPQDAPRLVLVGVPDSEQERAGDDSVFVYSS